MTSNKPIKQKAHLTPKDITAPRVTSTTVQVGHAEDVASALRAAANDIGIAPNSSRERQKGEFTAEELATTIDRNRSSTDRLLRKLCAEGKYERRWNGRLFFYKKIAGK